jgi:hypothetical protein
LATELPATVVVIDPLSLGASLTAVTVIDTESVAADKALVDPVTVDEIH